MYPGEAQQLPRALRLQPTSTQILLHTTVGLEREIKLTSWDVGIPVTWWSLTFPPVHSAYMPSAQKPETHPTCQPGMRFLAAAGSRS